MSERERLRELLLKCDPIKERDLDDDWGDGELDDIVDNLLANGVIVPPCKVGDTVYEVSNNTHACHDCKYYSDFYGMDAICDKDNDIRTYPQYSEEPLCDQQFFDITELQPSIDWIFSHRDRFGKTVFLTREEAEKALDERSKS